jgi:hypothetical protein
MAVQKFAVSLAEVAGSELYFDIAPGAGISSVRLA